MKTFPRLDLSGNACLQSRFVAAAMVACLAAGCGGSDPPAGDGSNKPGSSSATDGETPDGSETSTTEPSEEPAAETVKLPAPEQLSKLADATPPLDEGRITIHGPEGWQRASRNDKKYLARFQRDRTSQIPRIQLTAEDSDLASLTAENSAEFADGVREDDADEIAVIQEFGGRMWVYHKRRIRTSEGALYDVLKLHALRGGRHYVLELQCVGNTLDDFKLQLFSVANGLKFSDPAPSDEEEAGSDAP
ncbi:MAG: hypothetical protein N2C14_26550 [Planctomycetales bacterium]